MRKIRACQLCQNRRKLVELIESRKPGVLYECPECSYQILELRGEYAADENN